MSHRYRDQSTSGRRGGQARVEFTKDRMGFDKEIVARCQNHEGKSGDTVRRHRIGDQKIRDELSGKAATAARKSVTLARVKWMERDE